MPIVTIILTSSPMVTVTPAGVTPTATFAPTARIFLAGGIPGALHQALHCCAFSARWLFVCSSNYHGRTCVGSAQILGCWEYPRSCLWQIAGGSCNRGSRPLRFPEPSLERKGRSFVRPGWLLYQLIAVGQSPSNGFSCCGITLQAARAVSATV